MGEPSFSYLRNRSRRTLRIIERGRRFKLKRLLMRKGLSAERAKELASEYRYQKQEKGNG